MQFDETKFPGGATFSGAFGNYLASYEWDHFFTLTTEQPMSPDALGKALRQRFVRCLTRKAGRPLAWFFAAEGRASGHHHLHGLIYGTSLLTIRAIELSWPLGYTRILKYDPSRGAARYVVKDLKARHDDWDVSRRLPPKRMAGPHPPLW